ncbi:MAG TPA: four helix bundle protein [Bacteroidales bacterium]|nr:four helix bundle protein [Bacteroidales bacterium]
MKEIKSYTDLDVWIKSRALVKQIYLLTNNFPKEEAYSLTSQIRRAVISIPSNIAEGIARQYNNGTIQFFHISRGSIFELETQIILASDLGYLNDKQLSSVLGEIEDCKKLIAGFINYYKNKSRKLNITE